MAKNLGVILTCNGSKEGHLSILESKDVVLLTTSEPLSPLEQKKAVRLPLKSLTFWGIKTPEWSKGFTLELAIRVS